MSRFVFWMLLGFSVMALFVAGARADEGCSINASLCPAGSHLYCVTWVPYREVYEISCNGVVTQVILPCSPSPENNNCGHGG